MHRNGKNLHVPSGKGKFQLFDAYEFNKIAEIITNEIQSIRHIKLERPYKYSNSYNVDKNDLRDSLKIIAKAIRESKKLIKFDLRQVE